MIMTGELSRRDQFAMAAMQGVLSNPQILKQNGLNADDVTRDACQFADALIAELDRTAPGPVVDADGWIFRVPPDPIPLRHNGVRFLDGEESLNDCKWSDEAWNHTKQKGERALHITHYKP